MKKTDQTNKTNTSVNNPDSITGSNYLKLFYQSNAIMLFVDPQEDGDHKIIDANQAAIDFYGYPREVLLKLHCGDINTNKRIVRQKLMKKALKKSTNTLIFKHKLANNELKDVRVFASPIDIEQKKRMFLIIQDISEEIKAVQEIKEQQDYAQMLFNKSPDGLFIIDSKGKIIDGNNRTEQIIGARKEELIGENIFKTDLLSKADKVRFNDRIKRIIKGEATQMLEFVLNRRDGGKSIIEGKVEYILYKGKNYFLGTMRDITKRKEQELQLKQSEAKFRYLADYTFEWEYWISPEGKYNYISPSCELTSGYSASDFENNTNLLVEITHPDYKEMVAQHFLREVYDLTPHQMIFLINKKDGEEVWLEHSCKPIFDKEGEFIGKRGVNRDITKEKKALHLLKESNERFKNLSQLTFEGIMIQKNGIIQDVNQSFEKLSGYTRAELIGKSITMLIKNPIMDISVKESLKKEYAKPFETLFTKKDGTEFWVELEAKDYTIEGETFRVGAIRDISQRKKHELKQSIVSAITKAVIQDIEFEKLLQIIQNEINRLMDASNFYFAVHNKETSTLSVPYFSDHFVFMESIPMEGSLTGYLIEQKKSLMISFDDLQELRRQNKVIGVGKDSLLWLGVPLLKNDNVIGAFVVQSYTDKNAYSKEDQHFLEIIASQISVAIDRKQNEEHLKKALAKAQESDRLKSTFLATMSHELRTPLNAIIGFSDLVEEERDLDEIISFCKIINRSGNHLLGIVNEIFDITLIETGEIKISYDKYPIASIIQDVFQIIKEEQIKLNKEHLHLSYTIPDEYSNLIIKTDIQRVQQILLNLLKNALKFTDTGYIKYGFNVTNENNSPSLIFSVEDSGIGIAEDQQGIIFDVFRQADDSHTRKHDGVGLGLAISEKIITLLGGKIWLSSKLGEGTTFYFTIPCTMMHDKTIEEISENPTRDKAKIKGIKTVLIAEDQETNFSLLEFMLLPLNFNIIWAKDGKEVINIVHTNPQIDLILMDIRMPILNGLEATEIIKKTHPTIPIIAQTAYAISGDKEIALDAGCDDYISKPINKTELFEKINNFLK
ncbi:MAG: PAS domain S-box protein [Bacteroidales bacterium]|nr:PAS domain S-box protein [Bacteroidales bacterium]